MGIGIKSAPKTEQIVSALSDLATGKCDRCGAIGYVWVKLHSGFDLVFCGHHYAKAEMKLIPDIADIDDRRSTLS